MKPAGRHPVNALTAAAVKAQKAPGRYADGNGLYLEVEPTGSKRWTLRTVVHGRRRDIGLGSAQLVPLAEARDLAREMRKLARQGGDPLAERRRATATIPTFEEATKRVHADRQEGWTNEKHRAQFLNTLTTYAFPVIGSRRVSEIGTPDVLKVLAPIWTTKPETARRLRQRIRTVLDWATASGYRQGENPVEGVGKGLPRQNDRAQHHRAMLAVELPGFLKALDASPAGLPARLALELLILTAARTSEVLDATWSEFDLKTGLWTIAAERMKGGRPHRVPLPPRALEVLADARELSGGDTNAFVFPGRKRGTAMSQMTLLQMMRRMGRKEVVHGFRSCFRDWAAERTPFAREVAEAALAHVIKDKSEKAYARTDHLEKRRDLMEAWAAWCRPAGGNVVQMKSAL
ncbi:MAG: tyrosine-type recombinase/integrase [Dongiaceae bacterium]